jgi:hypothetical protein
LEVESIIDLNVNFAYETLSLYQKYMFLLNEMESVTIFIQSRQDEKSSPGRKKERTSQFHRSVFTMRKDEFFSEVNRYLNLYNEI